MQELAQGNKKFRVIDRAIGKNSFKIVTLLRLSPLLPLALSNYFYGLTSVDLPAYVAASWIGMLPGTVAYVTAGAQPHMQAGPQCWAGRPAACHPGHRSSAGRAAALTRPLSSKGAPTAVQALSSPVAHPSCSHDAPPRLMARLMLARCCRQLRQDGAGRRRG